MKASPMYEALDAVATDLGQIKTLAAQPDATPRMEAIRVALERTAQRLSDRSATTDSERDQLATLYRGILAASRIVTRLREHHLKPQD
jgi:hypothetical protein